MIDDALKVYNTIPFALWACLLGWAVSVGMTQPLKFALPLGWHPAWREHLTRFVAFISGFLAVVALIPTTTGILLGIATGLWSPIAYGLVLYVVKYRWPWLADFLSGDVRGRRSNRK